MANTQSLKEKIVKGTIFAIGLSLFGSVFSYLTRVLYSRSLSVEMYGLFFAVFGFFNIISVHADLGFGEAIAYFVPKYFKSKKYKELWNTFIYGQIIQVAVAILVAIILIILAPFLSTKYFKVLGSESLVYIFCVFLILSSVLNSLLQIFTGMQKIKYYSSLNLVKTALIFLFSLLFLIVGFHAPIFYALAWVLGYLITAIIFLLLFWAKYPILTRNELTWHKDIFDAMYKYAIPAFATTFIYSLIVSSDIFFLTLMRGLKDVGIYNVVVPIASISVILLSPLNNILFPLVSHLCEGEKEKLSLLLSKVYQIIPFVGVYFALFIILFPSSTVGLIFGQKWLGLVERPLIFFSLGYIAYLFSNVLGIITLGIGKVQERLKIFISFAILNLCLEALLIFHYGIMGAVISNSLIALGLSLIFTKVIRGVVYFQIPYGFYLKLLVVSIFTYTLARVVNFYPNNIFNYIETGILYTLVFLLLSLYFRILDNEFMIFFKNLLG